MAKANYKWKVEDAPTGPNKSIQFRGWPSAIYKNQQQDLCGGIQCKDDYTPFRARTGQHAPLRVRICDHSVHPFKWRPLEGEHATLDQAKAALAVFIVGHPAVMPLEFRQIAHDAVSPENPCR